MKKHFDSIWEENYKKGNAFNKYPYGELISVFFNSLKYLTTPVENILEVGCGAGNNLWFMGELGFNVYGIDGSETIVKEAKKTCQLRRVEANIQHGYFDDIPFNDGTMDIVIDRESLYCQKNASIKKSLKEIERVLKPGGMFITFRFNDNNPTLRLLENGIIYGDKLEDRTYENISEGAFHGIGTVNFATLDEIKEQHDFLDIKSINEHSNKKIEDSSGENYFFYSEYILVGVKK